MVVENAFGRLKGRFRILKKQNDCELKTIISRVAAAVTLHNICEMRDEIFDPTWMAGEDLSEEYGAPATNVNENTDTNVHNAKDL